MLLILVLLWMAAADPATAGTALVNPWAGLGVFFGTYALLVGALGLWSRWMARRITGLDLHRSLDRFNRVILFARFAIPAWFAVGVFALGWHDLITRHCGALRQWESLLVVVGIGPALLAWIGLWWSQFPADRALREQNIAARLEDGLPLHAAPTFGGYFASNLRLQVLLILVPVLMILLLRDLAMLGLRLGGRPRGSELIDAAISVASTGVIFIFAPQILRHVLSTQSLPDSSLRRRLEAMCARFGLKYRDILLWHTHGNMGNAAVVGIVPQLRYILLSDLLLESMDDRQIEAVFAHEMGHIVHRHLLWYVVFFVTMMIAIAGPGAWLADQLQRLLELGLGQWIGERWIGPAMAWTMAAAGVGAFLLVFGFLSRCFERQADVFAARTMQAELSVPDTTEPSTHVGRAGAEAFISALSRVAVVNNIPVRARSWCHGSIAHRMRHLHHMSDDPNHTPRFDRLMRRVYAGLLGALAACIGYLLLYPA